MTHEDRRRSKLSDSEIREELLGRFPYLVEYDLQVVRGSINLQVKGVGYTLGAYTTATDLFLREMPPDTW